jgi:futalosine hydrolase
LAVSRTLLVAAAPAEACAVLAAAGADAALGDVQWVLHPIAPDIELLITGIGKVNAGAAVARHADPARHRRIINLGVAGALPGSDLRIGDIVAATASIYADEGLLTPAGFQDCSAMGFPLGNFPGSAIAASPELLHLLKPLAHRTGMIATVSTCSGIDELALLVRERTGAIAECMEGAAVAHIAHRLGLPSAELRVISNTTGHRERQQWDLRGALAALSQLSGQVLGLSERWAS